ncbi:DNA translocase FtsK 4TM domain-containing protein, partial [Rhizobium johnstonii]|uniref:DNA translocase FtsK 4TM domain-containing protein n=1 Tax=Rhizobium johnstonii TaxID=3019933 RepID=UPI003F971510
NVADPSYSYSTANLPTNILGYSGAAFADIVMQFLWLASVVSMLPIVAWALTLISGRQCRDAERQQQKDRKADKRLDL